MEQYLQHMKNLRSQMNDFEEQSATISVEEEKQRSAVQCMESDLSSLKTETEGLERGIISMLNEKTRIIRDVAGKKKKIGALEAESSTLSQTLELLQQESAALSQKLKEKSIYYVNVMKEMRSKLQDQQVWLSSVEKNSEQIEINGAEISSSDNFGSKIHHMDENLGMDKYNDLIAELESGKAKKAGYRANKEMLSIKIANAKLEVDLLRERVNSLPTGLKEMPMNELKKERTAVLSDKAAEQEYVRSIHAKVRQIQDISGVIQCSCGEEYLVQQI